MKTKWILMMLFLPVAGISVAQEKSDKDDHKKKKEELESQKVAYITNKLELTTDESKAFWPVYDEREKEIKEVRKGIRENLKEGKDLDNLTDDEVKKLMDETLELKKKELEIEEKYNTKFQTVIPVKKVAKLYWAERKFNEEVLKAWRDKHDEHKGKPGDK